MTLHVRQALDSDDEMAAIVALANVVSPEDPTSVETMRWGDATYPGGSRWVATLHDRIVGLGTVGRIYMYAPEFDAYWATIQVSPDARRHGIGTVLLERLREHARDAGKTHLHVPANEVRPEGIAFLANHGFKEYERSKSVRLDLRGMTPPVIVAPDGIAITSLGAEPALVVGVHAVALAAFSDIPGGDRPMDAGDLAEFRTRDVDRPEIPPDAFAVAVDDTDGSVVGYAALSMIPGSATAAWHDMTAVRREARGRGIARALKLTTIAWAIRNGLQTLDTGNDVDNAPMRALNERLGYQPLPDEVTMRGPAAGGIIDP
jgi:mycothiol synthase